MKKKLTGFALLSSLFLLTACNATNTDISGSGDSTSKSEQVSGDSSETEEVSYDELYACLLYTSVAQNPSVVSDSSSLWAQLIRQFMQDTGHLVAFVCT